MPLGVPSAPSGPAPAPKPPSSRSYAQTYPAQAAANASAPAPPASLTGSAFANPAAVQANQLQTQLSKNVAAQLGGVEQGRANAISANNDQIGLAQDNYLHQAGYAGQDNNIAKGRLGLAVDKNGVDQAYLDGSYANDRNIYGLNRGYVDQVQGFDNTGYQNNLNSNLLTSDNAHRSNLSDATNRGAITSAGFGQQEQAIKRQLDNSNADAGLTRDRATGFNDNKRSNLDLGFVQTTLDYQHSGKLFDNAAKALGLDGQQAQVNYERGMQNLGYSAAQSQRLLQQANDTSNTQAAAQAWAVINQGIQNGSMIQMAYAPPITPVDATTAPTVDMTRLGVTGTPDAPTISVPVPGHPGQYATVAEASKNDKNAIVAAWNAASGGGKTTSYTTAQ